LPGEKEKQEPPSQRDFPKEGTKGNEVPEVRVQECHPKSKRCKGKGGRWEENSGFRRELSESEGRVASSIAE